MTEALNLFLQSTRVLFDVELDLLGGADLHTTLECRPWQEAALSSEWRCFVREGELKAISQYFTDLYFEHLPREKEAVKQTILQV